MSNKTFLTFVMTVDTAQGVSDICERYSTTLFSDKDLNWIIYDRSSEDQPACASILNSLNNISYYRVPAGTSLAECYNSSLKELNSEYVCFTNEHVIYDFVSVNGFKITANRHDSNAMISIDYKAYNPKRAVNKVVTSYVVNEYDLNNCKKLYTFVPSYIFRTDCIDDLTFNNVCEEETTLMFLLELWKQFGKILHVENVCCRYTDAFSLMSDSYYGCNNPDFYYNSLKENYIPFLNTYLDNAECVPTWLKRIIYYRLYFKYYANLNARNKFLVEDENLNEFFAMTGYLLSVVDDELILNNSKYEQFAPPFSIRNAFVYLKYNGDLKMLNRSFSFEGDKLIFNQCGCKYNLTAHKNIEVMAFNIRHGNLCIDLRYFTHLLFDYEPEAIFVKLNDEKLPLKKTEYYSLDKIFATTVAKHYTFLVEIPLEKVLSADTTISFYMQLDNKVVKLPLDFHRAPSKLNVNCPHSYWNIKDDYYLTFVNNKLVVNKFTDKQIKKREKLYLSEACTALKNHPKVIEQDNYNLKRKQLKKIRKEYFKAKPSFEGRRIWLYFDKLYKAGDNGEYAFRHAMTRDDGIECYYILNEDSYDYERLIKQYPDNILIYGSLKCQLYALMAENIVATHPDIIEFCGFDSALATVIKDLFNPNLICIAHGITIQKNADFQSRIFDNTMFYTTSSKYEVAHILKPIYGYTEDEVALTGLARFDGLKNDDKKQILITPTWRRNLVGLAQRNSTREYSELFKQTDYYKIYNSLINDDRIISTAKATGYKVIFLLHPAMSAQIDDYDRNDYVELIQASGDMSYEKILTQSSLMVTDYSGIHYDFGYMRKPIIYYQPKEVPMRFEEGGMKFATMAFGPVCSEYEDAVKLICEYMNNNCEMPQEYRKRADDFFAFDDFSSSERIYDAILKWTDERKQYD